MREIESLDSPKHRIKPLAAALAVVLALGAPAAMGRNGDASGLPRMLGAVRQAGDQAAMDSALPARTRSANVGGQRNKRADASLAIAVTSCDETSLRNAIAGAADGDTIDLTALSACGITLTTGSIFVNVDNLTLKGPGADQFTIDGGYYDYHYHSRIFTHTGYGTFSISGLSIGDADYRGWNAKGGCIYSSGSVAISASTVTGCMVEATSGSGSYSLGGAIYSRGDTSVSFSTVSQNTAYSSENGAYGGGVFARGDFKGKYSSINGNNARASAPHYSTQAPSPCSDTAVSIFATRRFLATRPIFMAPLKASQRARLKSSTARSRVTRRRSISARRHFRMR